MSTATAVLDKTPRSLRQVQMVLFNDGFVRGILTQLGSAVIAKATPREGRV